MIEQYNRLAVRKKIAISFLKSVCQCVKCVLFTQYAKGQSHAFGKFAIFTDSKINCEAKLKC